MKQDKFIVMLLVSIVALPLLTGALFGPPRLVVQPEAAAHLDELMDQWARDGLFSGSVLIAQDGVVYLSEGYGLWDREQEIPITSRTRFRLGSMSKQFTAMAILILQSQGRLNVQDPICDYTASCSAAWQDITIHQLLTHTSGLSVEQGNDRYNDHDCYTYPDQPGMPSDPAFCLGFEPALTLDTRPGEQFAYNNLGYVLLAHIIEQVSGQTYPAFLDQAIFTPLNMHNTGYHESSGEVASFYSNSTTTSAYTYRYPVISEGAGNLYSTTEDLLLWDEALYTDQLLPQAELEPMFERYVPTSDFPPFGYGYGWLVTKILGQPLIVGAGGGPYGHATLYLLYPADGLTLIVLMNQGGVDLISVLLAMAGALFLSDLIFVLTAIAFLLLLAVLLAAQKKHRVKTTWGFGVLWLLLAAPLALVFSRYLAEGRGLWALLPLSLVLLYMLVKALLDFVLRVDFRRNRSTRLAYLALKCLALSSLIWIAFGIHPSWGTPVLIAFGVLAVSLISMYPALLKRRRSAGEGE